MGSDEHCCGSPRLKGKTALITNATFGAGLATAKLFQYEGARVIITAPKSKDLSAALLEIGGSVTGFVNDSSDYENVKCGFQAFFKSCQGIDIFCAFAGQCEFATMGNLTNEHLQKAMAGVREVLFAVQAALPHLNYNGAMILGGLGTNPGKNADFVLNDATHAFTRHLVRAQVVKRNNSKIRLNILGYHDGPEKKVAPVSESRHDHNFTGSFGEPELIASNALYLALPECKLNGLEVYLDGQCSAF